MTFFNERFKFLLNERICYPWSRQEVDSTREELDIQRLWLIWGTISPKSLECRDLTGWGGEIGLCQTWWCLAIKCFVFEKKFLNSIQNFTGSQGREANYGEMWSFLPLPLSTHVAALWISCEKPDNKEFQEFIAEVTNAWANGSASFGDRMCMNFAILLKWKEAVRKMYSA